MERLNIRRSALLYAVVISIVWSASFHYGICEYMGTSESLRSNISFMLQGQCEFDDENVPYDPRELPDITPDNESEYDFIVVGAGSAGAIIAARLSEIEDFNVLLIEAGDKEYSLMDIPTMAGTLQLHDSIKWDYRTEPSDKYCLGFENGQCNWNRAKVMGGNSVFNYMLITRNNKEDYNEWARLTGDESWGHDNMMKYLMKLENYDVKTVDYDKSLHNTDGPLPVTGLPYQTQLRDAFMAAGQELGYSGNTDYNGHRQIGFSSIQINVKDGERWSTNRAYLRPANGRKNLKVTHHSLVEKVLIDSNKRAYGVRFSKAGKTYDVKARKEVILSAGSINSAQILMLSGIGPADHLRDLGIQCIKHAPVGHNLMDHYAYGGLVFRVNDSNVYNTLPDVNNPMNPAVEQYLEDRGGPLALPTAFEALGYINVDDLGRDNDRPNIEFMFAPMAGMKDPILSKVVKIDPKYRKIMDVDKANHSFWTAWPMIMMPKSRGRVLLRSNKITDKPKIIPNYFGDPDDIRVIRKGIREILRLSCTNAFQKFGSELYQVPLPNCKHLKEDSDEYWECAMRTYPFTIYHHSGTCRMGKKEQCSSVVDPELKVIGIKRLRVVDASVMPKIVSAHPAVPIMAIAEKICDDIKDQYGYGKNKTHNSSEENTSSEENSSSEENEYSNGDNGYDNRECEFGNEGDGNSNEGNGNEGHGYGNEVDKHNNGGYGHGQGEYGYGNGEHGYGNEGDKHNNGGYGHGQGEYGYGNGGHGYGNEGDKYSNGGYGYGHGGHGYGHRGHGYGHGGNGYGNGGYRYDNKGGTYNNGGYGYGHREHGYGNGWYGYGNRYRHWWNWLKK